MSFPVRQLLYKDALSLDPPYTRVSALWILKEHCYNFRVLHNVFRLWKRIILHYWFY